MYGYQGEKGSGMNWEIGIAIYTLLVLCIKEISKEDLPHSAGNSPSALWWLKREGNPKRGDVCTHVADPLCSTVETNTMFESNYTPIHFLKYNEYLILKYIFISIQSLSHVRLFVAPWIAARQASLSITNSQSLLKLMSIELVMPSSHLIRCQPLLSYPQSLPASASFPVSQLFKWGGQSTGVSASASVLPMNTQDWLL